jgi:hypothetical protein
VNSSQKPNDTEGERRTTNIADMRALVFIRFVVLSSPQSGEQYAHLFYCISKIIGEDANGVRTAVCHIDLVSIRCHGRILGESLGDYLAKAGAVQ